LVVGADLDDEHPPVGRVGAESFEYPKGHWMTCNDWVIDPPED